MNLKRVLSDRRLHRLALVSAVLGAGVLLLAWKLGYGLADAKAHWEDFQGFMEHRPWLLFVAILILPGFPVPISPVVFLAGAIYHEHPILACLGCLLALMANQAWCYWLAAGPGRRVVRWVFEKSKVEVPVVAKHNQMNWMLIVRLTPGFPLFIQNYLLGFIGIPYLRYMWVSIFCSGSIACGMVLTGAGMGDGRIEWVLGGLSLLIVVIVVLRIIGKRISSKSEKES